MRFGMFSVLCNGFQTFQLFSLKVTTAETSAPKYFWLINIVLVADAGFSQGTPAFFAS